MNEVVDIEKRDYSLVGASTQRAIESGLVSAEWYHSDVPRKTMKELMQRSDGPRSATRSCGSPAYRLGGGAIYFWGSWPACRSFSSMA